MAISKEICRNKKDINHFKYAELFLIGEKFI